MSHLNDKRATYKLNTEFNGDIVIPKKFVFSVRPEELEQSLSELAEKMNQHYSERFNAAKHNLLNVEAVKSKLGFCYQVTTKSGQQFRDYGDRITSEKSDVKPGTASEIVRAAKARGWTKLTITGTQEYKDEIAFQAALQGIKTNHELSAKAQQKLKETQIQFNGNRNKQIIQRYIKQQQSSFDM